MKVFKLGGAGISNIGRIKAAAGIVEKEQGRILIVLSAMGKTTNALEKVAEAFYESKSELALELFGAIKKEHLSIFKELVNKAADEKILSFFTEIEWLLHDKPVREYDYYYDQIVCIGELLSSAIVSAYFNEVGIKNALVDVRDVMRTDDNFREGNVDISYTERGTTEIIAPLLKKISVVITQGFIGSTDENESTTLGREGSDYTAALLANMLNAESLTIWKDVEGVMSADPKEFKDAKLIDELSYEEVIEMSYYGAQVIHPKTIKPLQNKNIPMHVRSFLNTKLKGTTISKKAGNKLPAIIVLKQKQVLIELISKDYSFVGEKPVSELYKLFAELHIKPNLTQNGAISLLICLDDHPEKIEALALAASDIFDVKVQKGLTLLTVRHYTDKVINDLLKDRKVLLEQKTRSTVQYLMEV